MPVKIPVRLGLAFLFAAAAIYFSTSYWLASRIFTPLDYPVSLESRQIKSPPFQINLRETYFVSLHLDNSVGDWYDDGRCNYKNALGSEWRIYRLSAKPRELWANSDEMTRRYYYYYFGGFTATSGQYELEWDLPAGANCLDHRHPRLMVHTGSTGYKEGVAFIQTCLIFLGGTGAGLVLLALARVLRGQLAADGVPRIFPDMVLRNALPITKHAPLVPIHGMPHWGLFCGSILWILVFISMILQPLPPQGIFVSLKSRDPVIWGESPWPDTLEVYVRVPARFFINDQEVERNNLRAKLTEHLSRRAEWTVYFEADPDTLYMDDLYAIDTIQACGAKLIWVTPGMRAEGGTTQHPIQSEARKELNFRIPRNAFTC